MGWSNYTTKSFAKDNPPIEWEELVSLISPILDKK